MNWNSFNNHGESNNHAFEVMCNLLFEIWCKEEYRERLKHFSFVNGSGGDGGVEAFGILDTDEVIGIQSKWFQNTLQKSQLVQIQKSFETALKVRPNIKKYIVCIPRNLGSKRMGKDGRVILNSEADRWDEFITTEKVKFDSVEIILWDDTRIQEKLTRPQALGIYKYWFETTHLFDIQIETSFLKATNSWAKAKYIPEVYSFGHIHNRLEVFLGSAALSKRRYKETNAYFEKLLSLKRTYIDLLKLGIPNKEKSLQEKIEKDIPVIDKWLNSLEMIRESIINGSEIQFENSKIELTCKNIDLKNSKLQFGKFFHIHEIEKLLNAIEDDFYSLRRILDEDNDNRLIILGNQGTGKTAGIVAEASSQLDQRCHLPILVRAKDFSDGDTWLDILEKTIGLPDVWEERSLLCALQSAALYRSDIEGDISIEPKCVIFVDGIDEAKSWQFWKEKINEVTAYKDDFPRIRFVFISRPYVFENINEIDCINCIFRLPTEGDVSAEEICDKYFSTYHVNIGNNNWIKRFLKTPDSVRLFCDIYKNSTIQYLPHNTLVITNLYKKKLEELDKGFKEKQKQDAPLGLLRSALIEIADVFLKRQLVTYSDINNSVSEQIKKNLDAALDYLSAEGFIFTYSKQDDEFCPSETYYSWGRQPALDYLHAQKLYLMLKDGEEIAIKCVDGVYQMLALITIEEGKLLSDYPNVSIDDDDLFALNCFALANCSLNAAAKFRNYTKQLFRASVEQFRKMVNDLVIPVSDIEDHPLGAVLLDEYLREFESPSIRDIWWSIPALLRGNYDAEWHTYYDIDFESLNLNLDDSCNGKPLVLAWSLTSVNNELRQKSRMKLINWAIRNPFDFLTLFKKCIDTDDLQMEEELFAIAFGVALKPFISDSYLIQASSWMLDNVFTGEGLINYENTVIRYYAEGIVRIAISKDLCARNLIKIIKPPYDYNVSCLPLYKEALNSKRMDGYSAIHYDLSRYVLCDSVDYFFRIDYQTESYNTKIQEFITKYKTAYDMTDFSMDGFTIAAAFQFLLDQGWNPEFFWSYADQKNMGVDIIIRGTYFQATHGQKSKIMTVAEKNVWLAKHKIEAVLSNELPYCKYYGEYKFIDDYSQFESFINPYQDYINEINRNSDMPWFNMDSLANPTFYEMSSEKINEWIQENYTPDFEKWVSPINNETFLYSFTNVQNSLSGVEETVWISSGVVETNMFEAFLDTLEKYSEERLELKDVSDFQAYQDCGCFCTPQEACLIHSDREIENRLVFNSEGREIIVYKLVRNCLCADELETERSFTIPTNLTWKTCGIQCCDGFSYYDKEGKEIAHYSETGEQWGTRQIAFRINTELLNEGLEKRDYKLFWVFRNNREPTNKAFERFEGLLNRTNRSFIIWKEGRDYKYRELVDIERPKEDWKEGNSIIQGFLKKYKSDGTLDSFD